MLALAQMFPAFGWPNADDIVTSQEQYNYFDYKEHAASENFVQFNIPSKPKVEFDNNSPVPSYSIPGGDPTLVKKLTHNASERDRRKRINFLYFTLRSLLPDADQTKKLSIPATISRVLKYIPELQQQVESLNQKKEDLISKISRQDDVYHQGKNIKRSVHSTSCTGSASLVGDREVVVQISACKLQQCSLSDILLVLEEEEGLLLIDYSTSDSFAGRIFYNLHLQVGTSLPMDCEALREKLLTLYEKRGGLLQ